MSPLPLDDPRWLELDHRGWHGGQAALPEAPSVAAVLARLHAQPDDLDTFHKLAPWLCSEDTTWAAAYAAVPHAVQLAEGAKPASRLDYLLFVGQVVTHACPTAGPSFALPAFLQEAYGAACKRALVLLGELLPRRHSQADTRYLLAAIAALKGNTALAEVLESVSTLSESCPACGEEVYPEALQKLK